MLLHSFASHGARPFVCTPVHLPARAATARGLAATARKPRSTIVSAQQFGSRASTLCIELNKEIRRMRTLEDLETLLITSNSIDAVNVSTFWLQLVNLVARPRDLVACQSFARKHLLSKALAFMPDMGLRQLANLLYAMGKLKLDLQAEQLGPYLTEHIEARASELICKEGLDNSMDVNQLWYGLALCRWQWDAGLLLELFKGTLTHLAEWDSLIRIGDTLASIAQLSARIQPTEEQKAQLVTVLERVTERLSRDISELRALNGMAWAARAFSLPVSQRLLHQQLDLALEAPPEALSGLRDARGFYVNLVSNCVATGLRSAAPAEAQRWFKGLDAAQDGDWTVWELSVGLGALAQLDTFSVTPEVEEVVLATANNPKLVRSSADTRSLLELCAKLGITLPGDVRERLARPRGTR